MSDLFSNLAERTQGGTPALAPLHSFYRPEESVGVPEFEPESGLESSAVDTGGVISLKISDIDADPALDVPERAEVSRPSIERATHREPLSPSPEVEADPTVGGLGPVDATPPLQELPAGSVDVVVQDAVRQVIQTASQHPEVSSAPQNIQGRKSHPVVQAENFGTDSPSPPQSLEQLLPTTATGSVELTVAVTNSIQPDAVALVSGFAPTVGHSKNPKGTPNPILQSTSSAGPHAQTRRATAPVATSESEQSPAEQGVQDRPQKAVRQPEASGVPTPTSDNEVIVQLAWDRTARATETLPVDAGLHQQPSRQSESPAQGQRARNSSARPQLDIGPVARPAYQQPLASPAVIEQEERHVTVSIGRLEVRVNSVNGPKPQASPARNNSALTDYLREREGGGR